MINSCTQLNIEQNIGQSIATTLPEMAAVIHVSSLGRLLCC
jgi:hypothetical protein